MALKTIVPDPQNQLSVELPEVFLPIVKLMQDGAEFVELGSTFFASIEKLELASKLLNRPLRNILFSGIEYSSFMHQAAKSLHPGIDIQLVREPAEWKRSRDLAVHVTRFVGSYAFRSTDAFASELMRCDAFHIIDAFSLGDEFQSWDLALPITFFDVERLRKALPGFDIYLGKATPEYHWTLKKKAMVLRLFGVRKGLSGHDEPRLGDGLGNHIDQSLSAEQWASYAEQKKHFPIWSGPGHFDRAPLQATMDLHFSDGELAEAVTRAKWL